MFAYIFFLKFISVFKLMGEFNELRSTPYKMFLSCLLGFGLNFVDKVRGERTLALGFRYSGVSTVDLPTDKKLLESWALKTESKLKSTLLGKKVLLGLSVCLYFLALTWFSFEFSFKSEVKSRGISRDFLKVLSILWTLIIF